MNWGYAADPGRDRRPTKSTPTLDAWARQQDEFPWLRFTTPGRTGQSDAGNLTEAVGDADAVKSTGYGMRNLERVMDMLLDVAEVPGESYEELETLYGQAVGQWGRYMGHVAAIVGGAYTQEKYGTGERFEPLEKARQREAVRYLNETAFHVPEMFLDEAILRRIETSGVVDRFRTQQQRVVNNLLNQARLQRLVEFEAMADNPSNTYTIADLMTDMRAGIWDELDDGTVRVNAYRRNLQRAFLDAVDSRLHPSAGGQGGGGGGGGPFGQQANTEPWMSDVRGVLSAELEDIDAMAERALGNAGDAMTRIHLRDVRREIARILGDEG